MDASQPKQNEVTSTRDLVLIINGIRDRGMWAQTVQNCLEKIPGVTARSVRFDRVNAFQFWGNFSKKLKQYDTVDRGIKAFLDSPDYKDFRISVIAHSFGTDLTAKFLLYNPNVKFHNVIFCGGVASRDMPWQTIIRSIHNKKVNECGTRDIWPAIAANSTWGYSDIGSSGLGFDFIDRFHRGGHGCYMELGNIEKFWKPIFEKNEVVKSDINNLDEDKTFNFWFWLASLPIWKYVLYLLFQVTQLALLLVLFWCLWWGGSTLYRNYIGILPLWTIPAKTESVDKFTFTDNKELSEIERHTIRGIYDYYASSTGNYSSIFMSRQRIDATHYGLNVTLTTFSSLPEETKSEFQKGSPKIKCILYSANNTVRNIPTTTRTDLKIDVVSGETFQRGDVITFVVLMEGKTRKPGIPTTLLMEAR